MSNSTLSSSSPSIQRDTSFRTALKNQKRRLSATKAPTPSALQTKSAFDHTTTLKPLTTDARKGNNTAIGEEESATVAEDVKQTTPDTVAKEEETKKAVRKTVPALQQLASSPYLPRTPSPLVQDEGFQLSPKPLQQQQQPPLKGNKSPIPPGSPLLCKRRDPPSPTAQKCREFNRELRRARSFRKSMERSRESSRNRDLVATSEDEAQQEDQDEISFCIRQHLRGKQGWIIMPESGSLRPDALQRVVGMIKQMELSGHTIPERITIKA